MAKNLGQTTALTSLRLQNNKLTSIPGDLGELPSLKVLHVADNQLQSVSPAIGRLANLEQLFLDSNRDLAALPPEILNLPDECQIFLFGTSLPEAMQSSSSIAELRQAWQ